MPPGVHVATLDDVTERFGEGTPKRRALANRLKRIYSLAARSGGLARFVVFGSFVTRKAEPNDVDIFMIMDDGFDAGTLTGEAVILFDHMQAQSYFGASVFWVRRLAALGGDDVTIGHWQIKRDGTTRGIVEVRP